MNYRQHHLFVMLLCSVSCIHFFAGCSTDSQYSVTSADQIDTEMTLFQDGLELPIGHTDKIHLKEVISATGSKGLDTVLVKDPGGDYSLRMKGSYSLGDVVSKLDLEKISRVSGVSINENFTYEIGDYPSGQFTIKGLQNESEIFSFPVIDMGGMAIPPLRESEKISTELFKFRPGDMSLTDKLPQVKESFDMFSTNSIIESLPAVPEDMQVNIQPVLDQLGYSSCRIDKYTVPVSAGLSLGDNASKIRNVGNFQLAPGGKLKVSVELVNSILVSGDVIPNVAVDATDIMKLSGADKDGLVNLSSIVLNEGNGYKNSGEFSIVELADGTPAFTGTGLSCSGNLSMGGTINVLNAFSTLSKIKSIGGEMVRMKVTMQYENFTIASMDITLNDNVKFDLGRTMEVPFSYSSTLPQEVLDVPVIYLDKSVPLNFTISADNLKNVRTSDGKGHLSIEPQVEITFPSDMKVAGTDGDNKMYLTGDLAEGDVVKDIVIESIRPSVKGSELSFDGKVMISVTASAKGSFSVSSLPTGTSDDIIVVADAVAAPRISDFDLTLNDSKLSRQIDRKFDFSFPLDNVSSLGTFDVTLKGKPAAVVDVALPSLSELALNADNLVISLPQMLKVDGTSVSGYSAANHAITFNGEIPSHLTLPITGLKVTPQKDSDGKTVVNASFNVSGRVNVSSDKVTRKSVDEMSGAQASLKVTVPDFEAESISLEGDFTSDFSSDFKDMEILGSDALSKLPKELKYISELDFEEVYLNYSLSLTDLPDFGTKVLLKNTTLTLPEFITAEGGSNVVSLGDLDITGGKVVSGRVKIADIHDVSLENVTCVKGDIHFASQLYSRQPKVDISTLKSQVGCRLAVGIGNGQSAASHGDIVISKALVKADYAIDQQQKIELGFLSDGTLGADTNLDLYPELTLTVNTNLGVPIKGDLSLIPFKAGQPLTQNILTLSNLELPYSSDAASKASKSFDIHTELCSLFKQLPDSVVVRISANVDKAKTCVIQPSAKYECDIDYCIDIPVMFGSQFKLSANANVDVEKNLENILSYGVVRLSADVVNTMPIGVECNVSLLDSNSVAIPLKEPIKAVINPSPDHKPTTTAFSVTVNPVDGASARLRKIALHFDVKTSPDVKLNESDYIQVMKISAILPEGITFDPKKLGE